MNRIWPNWNDIETLRTPLTDGERTLAQFLDTYLPPTWRIYVQPYINDMRPDVVILNPLHGIVVFEVKDWSLARYHFDAGRLIARTAHGEWVEDNPVDKVNFYARSIYQQFLASDEAELELGETPNDCILCRPVVYFHKATSSEINQLYEGRRQGIEITGADDLVEDNLEKLVPRYWAKKANFVRQPQADALERAHNWLVPPKHTLEQQQPSRLSSGQAEYAKPETGFRRIRGVAGAGKSFVLSHRAARANQEGRNVLLLCFNITMSHVLHDLLKRAPFVIDWRHITWRHFHGWALQQIVEAGLNDDRFRNSGFDDDKYIDALECILSNNNLARGYIQPRYGGIYIDEGQDFDPRWLDILAGFLSPDGELVLCADHRQNVYGKDGGRDIHKMRRCRFRGRWAQLPQKSHRLPWRIAMFLNEFAERANLGDEEDWQIQDYTERPIQGDIAFDVMNWRNVTTIEEGVDALDDALECLGNPNPSDVVILVPNHDTGLQVVEHLRRKNCMVVHIFAEDQGERQRRKNAFWMGRGGFKACTVKSFKGWELDNVILIWPSDEKMKRLSTIEVASTFYTGISRGMRNIVVLNANRSYDQYGTDWDSVPMRSSR